MLDLTSIGFNWIKGSNRPRLLHISTVFIGPRKGVGELTRRPSDVLISKVDETTVQF